MKKIYAFACLMLPFVLVAQKKVDLDVFHVTVQYRALPKIRIDSTYRTYNVNVEGSKLMNAALQDMDPVNTVRVEGWRKLPEKGHLDVDVKVEDLIPESFVVKERTENITNRLNQITGVRTFYHQEVVYTFAAKAIINDYHGAHIADQVLADRGYKQVYRSPEFAVKGLAEGYFMVNAVSITQDLYRSCVTRAMHYLSDRLTEDFGYNAVSVNDNLWVVGSRKHPEYTANRDAVRQISDVLFGMSADQPIDGLREQLKPAISYFESILRNYNSSSKHDRKIRYASYYNLAVLYYYLDDPQQMLKMANALVLNDYNEKDGRAFEQTAVWLKNQFDLYHVTTRHFPVDASKYRGPYEKDVARQ